MDVQLEMIDLGDAIEETKQWSPGGSYADCFFVLGKWPGCG